MSRGIRNIAQEFLESESFLNIVVGPAILAVIFGLLFTGLYVVINVAHWILDGTWQNYLFYIWLRFSGVVIGIVLFSTGVVVPLMIMSRAFSRRNDKIRDIVNKTDRYN